MNYLKWIRKTFPELGDISCETVNTYIQEAKSRSELLREFLKVLGFSFIVIPFNLFLSASDIQAPLYWVLLLASIFVGGLVSLYFEQQLIKKSLRKIVSSKYS
ncbi:hypothetical protein [uncultured Paraglaciecola sp.]|uniref:hypothetical protein n=1 Tax=uncultured Paraglaciecola sp. TaxID=1765024 RepID=UPI0026002C3D|nr:hypothetical protein [uncultured Paraglaciecola sp.]